MERSLYNCYIGHCLYYFVLENIVQQTGEKKNVSVMVGTDDGSYIASIIIYFQVKFKKKKP